MTRVDFYVFESGNDDSFSRFICRLTEKAWRQGNRIFMHCPDHQVASRFEASVRYREVKRQEARFSKAVNGYFVWSDGIACFFIFN